MLRSALRELKYHPARYAATLVAIAISVGFVAAASIITATEFGATTKQSAARYASADIVISIHQSEDDLTTAQVKTALATVDGVEDIDQIISFFTIMETKTNVSMVQLTVMPSEPFLYTSLKEGSWPVGSQVVMNTALAKSLDVAIGDQVIYSDEALTVSGITAEPQVSFGANPVIVSSTWFYDHYGDTDPYWGEWVVTLNSGADTAMAASSVREVLEQLNAAANVYSNAEYARKLALENTGEIDVFKYVLWVFAGIAVVVGMITIANTFTILLAQRRRQIGLTRSIGATTTQIRRSIWAEAGLLGLIGGLLGIALAAGLAALVGLFTGSIHFGVVIPWLDAAIAVGIGLVVTLVASITPARRATKIPPIEALQIAAPATQVIKGLVVRAIICTVLAGGGLALFLYSLSADRNALLFAVVGAMLLATGVLFGARLFVPPLLTAAGALVRWISPVSATAAKNLRRDPARASATTTALMLAVGLVITLQVGAASMSASVIAKVEKDYPIDLYVSSWSREDSGIGMSDDVVRKLAAVKGVSSVVAIECRPSGTLFGDQRYDSFDKVCNYSDEVASFAPGLPASLADDRILVNPRRNWDIADGDQVHITTTTSEKPLTAVAAPVAMGTYAFVSPEIYAQLPGASFENSVVFMLVPSPSSMASVLQQVNVIVGADNPYADVDGYLFQKGLIEDLMNIIVSAVTALLGVAVVIALVGVGNTLTLSVIERARENAMLRALGFKRGQLRAMLGVEAVLLTVVGGLIGLGAGCFFGYMGASAIVAQMRAEEVEMDVYFALNWGQTLSLLAVLVVAAGLASILPGRRAAKASPVEALADV